MVSLSLGVGGLPPLSGACGGHAGGQLGDRGLGVLFLLCVARGGMIVFCQRTNLEN